MNDNIFNSIILPFVKKIITSKVKSYSIIIKLSVISSNFIEIIE